jgi:uncharacterized membrane protein YedE/YeeE
MRMQSFTIMKMFLAAVGSSMLCQAVLHKVKPGVLAASREPPSNPGWVRAVCGGLLVGVGMTTAGAGPTMFPAAMQAVNGSLPLLAGALAGGTLFWVLDKKVGAFPPSVCGNPNTQLLDKRQGRDYATVAMAVGTALVAASWGIEKFSPIAGELKAVNNRIYNPLLPTLAGCIVGLNQLPLRVLYECAQGGSASIMTMLSLGTNGLIAPEWKPANLAEMAQFIYVWIGTALGACYALGSLAPEFTHKQAYPPLRMFLGGALGIFGARMAGGCTCGHGVSGFSELNLVSFVVTACIFAGGMATANLVF